LSILLKLGSILVDKKKGVVFCLQSACPDTQDHLFLELPSNTENSDFAGERSSSVTGSIYTQLRQNNRSQLLCSDGAGLAITGTIWKHVYMPRFKSNTLVEILQGDKPAGDLDLNACENLWPINARRGTTSDSSRLRLCDKQRKITPQGHQQKVEQNRLVSASYTVYHFHSPLSPQR
jgi:hypothetical protein